ncbi:hypothetical protein GC102_34065 [Paenibacillus sp. LMG 31460]|uniref:SLH domain-containing protein n=1 Tax=Paenibacillus germinis TaxID=2654979 RepID=A0ABX1ZBJ6_9BACL|nr:S-layer homology domain-containing protein [Paenibacillus germinis]NOU90718.1 hypothetical protein [Paenibacillus germinis]
MNRKTIINTLICSICSFMWLAPVHAEKASDFAMTASDTESASEQFTVSLKGQNIKDLFAYEAKFSFDPEKLEVVKAESHMKGFSVSPIVKNNEITIAHTKIGNVDGEKGDVEIGTVTFKAKKVGTSAVKWTTMKIIDHNLKDQQITVNATTDFTKIFSDLSGHWAKSDIMQMVSQRIVEGMDDDHFVPDDNVTRAQFATLIAKALKLKDAAVQNPFADVSSGAWYESTVKKAYAAGLLEGVSDSEFAPERNITREEMTAMLMRAKAYSKGVKADDLTVGAVSKFNDENAISDWAKKSVTYVIGSGLMNGRTEYAFSPQEQATRAESAVVMKRLLSGL